MPIAYATPALAAAGLRRLADAPSVLLYGGEG